jgi:hypothetical protein
MALNHGIESLDHHLGTRFFVHDGMASAVKPVQFVRGRVPYTEWDKSLNNCKIHLKENVKLLLFEGYTLKVFKHSLQFHAFARKTSSRSSSSSYVQSRMPLFFCDDIPDPCLQTFNSCNLMSTNLILNITPQKEDWRCYVWG